MRGIDEPPVQFFSYVDIEGRIPPDHPLRLIRALVDEVLHGLSRVFAKLYARHGRPGVPPERLLRALLLQAFYSVRFERLLMEIRLGNQVDAMASATSMARRDPMRHMLPRPTPTRGCSAKARARRPSSATWATS